MKKTPLLVHSRKVETLDLLYQMTKTLEQTYLFQDQIGEKQEITIKY